MNILWITNILFPEALAKLTGQEDFRSSGGWMLGAANELIVNNDIILSVATVSPLVNELVRICDNRIVYYVIPYGKGNTKINTEYQKYWIQVRADVKPDIVHIHGTEFSHGHAYMQACGSENVVISIQGMKSAYSYYHYGISKFDILQNLTLRDILKGTILADQNAFRRASKYEMDMLRMAQHIVGRTSWDKARTWAINPNANYYHCNETLREEFYNEDIWEYNKCDKHTIFISQASYPIKGLHQLLKAMPLILRHYPNTKIRVAGADITRCATLKDIIHYTGYGRYLKRLINELSLADFITFTGPLNAVEMRDEYLKCNVFVCPSSIENSPNSLAEAQILGVPCLASYVGGIPDMMAGSESNLYRFEEVEMLAEKVVDIFSKKDNVLINRELALKRHDRTLNCMKLQCIYREIIGA